MKKLFLIFLFVGQLFATTYYVKNGGNDALAGTSDATAWATLFRVPNTVYVVKIMNWYCIVKCLSNNSCSRSRIIRKR